MEEKGSGLKGKVNGRENGGKVMKVWKLWLKERRW